MTLAEIKDLVMHQINMDSGDVGDYQPYLDRYLNEGYDKLVWAYAGEHPTHTHATYPMLTEDSDEPETPEWTHQAIADWATWRIYQNGTASRQQKGYPFRSAAQETINLIRVAGGSDGLTTAVTAFSNVPD